MGRNPALFMVFKGKGGFGFKPMEALHFESTGMTL